MDNTQIDGQSVIKEKENEKTEQACMNIEA